MAPGETATGEIIVSVEEIGIGADGRFEFVGSFIVAPLEGKREAARHMGVGKTRS